MSGGTPSAHPLSFLSDAPSSAPLPELHRPSRLRDGPGMDLRRPARSGALRRRQRAPQAGRSAPPGLPSLRHPERRADFRRPRRPPGDQRPRSGQRLRFQERRRLHARSLGPPRRPAQGRERHDHRQGPHGPEGAEPEQPELGRPPARALRHRLPQLPLRLSRRERREVAPLDHPDGFPQRRPLAPRRGAL